MIKPSNSKIEHRALNTLESIIDDHFTMDHDFKSQDKEMSWDGYILLFKQNNGDQSKKNLESRVPVQIKGHIDETDRYMNNEKINYPVSLDDLNLYSTEKGVLYFQIFMNDIHREIFYCSLYPSKILDYLEKAKKRHNEKNINIPFLKLQKNPTELSYIVKQFSDESLKQGTVYTPLVQDRIRKEDFDKIKSINLSVVGAKNPYEAFLRLSSGDVCFYGKTDGDKYGRPLEWIDNTLMFMEQDVYQEIAVENKVYYHNYCCRAGSEGSFVIILSPNLRLNVEKQRYRVNFTPTSTISEIYNDVQFLLHLNSAKSFSLAGHKINFICTLDKKQQEGLMFHKNLYELLEMIELKFSSSWSQLTKQQEFQFKQIVKTYYDIFSKDTADGYYKFLWSFDSKFIPIVINKSNNTVKFFNGVYSNKLAIYLSDEDSEEKGFRMPLFANQKAETLSNLYLYDFELFRKQIDNSEVNLKTASTVNNYALLMISVFDFNGDLRFLDLADYLLQKIDHLENEEILVLNKLQIKKRRDTFSKDDVKLLGKIIDSDIHIKFGKSVLLEDKMTAEETFNKLSEKTKKQYESYPIYKLYLDL